MVKLFCAIVGEARSAFPVDIDAGQTVGDLKDAVKTKINYLGPAYELQLFLAKTTNGAWLDGAGAAAVALNECGHPQGTITKLVEMDPLLWLKNTKYFGKNFQPGEGQVHVLVVVPSDPTIEKLKKQKKDDGSSAQDGSYYWSVADLFSLLWPLDKIHSTKKDV